MNLCDMYVGQDMQLYIKSYTEISTGLIYLYIWEK